MGVCSMFTPFTTDKFLHFMWRVRSVRISFFHPVSQSTLVQFWYWLLVLMFIVQMQCVALGVASIGKHLPAVQIVHISSTMSDLEYKVGRLRILWELFLDLHLCLICLHIISLSWADPFIPSIIKPWWIW